ncbi:hypothetical protein QYE76_010327 [Lolium multiflorum]|uniref:Uncharacterized protein n=1 Tax=Lolium multiflorum TaxID=4521 RepID=A0AAD8TX27_LOLMU|nr:hypothetical protein QYE76_010327 [Lolium multiflorum]
MFPTSGWLNLFRIFQQDRIPTAQELEEELQGQARMAAKVQETENKKASKARNREGERGRWWPCETTDTELRELRRGRIFLPGYGLRGKPALLIPRVGDKAEGGGAAEGACREATAEKNSELIREKGEVKRNADSETIKRQQKELNGLRKYMETAEHHWDLLAENILEPLGYSERRRNKFPRDDVLSLAGDDCKDLISASRKICHNLSLKKSRSGLRKLVKRMDILPELWIYKLHQPEAQLP